MLSAWQLHIKKYEHCTNCDLCHTRTKIVLARGTAIPCDILFIGEAPGPSEDILGKPFIGPAGKRMDIIIYDAGIEDATYCLTNLIACFPKSFEEGKKFDKPPEESVEACAPRLVDFIKLCNPKLIINVGEDAAKWLPKLLPPDIKIPSAGIRHPGWILRQKKETQGLLEQTASSIIRDAWLDVLEHKEKQSGQRSTQQSVRQTSGRTANSSPTRAVKKTTTSASKSNMRR